MKSDFSEINVENENILIANANYIGSSSKVYCFSLKNNM